MALFVFLKDLSNYQSELPLLHILKPNSNWFKLKREFMASSNVKKKKFLVVKFRFGLFQDSNDVFRTWFLFISQLCFGLLLLLF